MDMNMTMHKDYFLFSNKATNFLLKNLNIHTTAGIVAVCCVIGVFTVLLEGTKAFMLYLQLRLKQNPLTYGQTSTSIQSDRSPLFSALMIPSSINQIRRQRIQYHVGGYFLHTINLILGYLIMLAVMTFNAYILIAVILGSGVGFYFFGAVSRWNQTKYMVLASKVYERYDSRVALTDQQIEVIQ